MMRRGQPLIAGYWYMTQLVDVDTHMFVISVNGEFYTALYKGKVRGSQFSPSKHTWTRMSKCEAYDVEHRTR